MLMSAEPFWEIVFDPDGKEPESRWFPVCGKEMKVGKVAYQPSAGLHFLPPGERLPHVLTKSGIEKRGGIALDGPNNLGLLESDGTLPAHICRSCRKIVIDY